MQYRPLGQTGLNVSEIGLGTMMFGEKTSAADATRIIARALEEGVNLVDVADVYAGGESERIVGQALKGRRDKVVLATKLGRPTPLGQGLSRAYVMQAVDASLQRLQTDYIDLYQVHRFDPDTPLDETLEALDSLVQQGKVRAIGCSNFETWQLYKAHFRSGHRGLARFESLQPRYNLVVRDAEAELLPYCHATRVGVLAYSPLAGGILTGKYRAEIPAGSRAWHNDEWQHSRLTPEARRAADAVWAAAGRLGRPAGEVAIRWCLAHPAVTSALVGPRTPEQWEQALSAATWSLSPSDARAISEGASN